MENRIHIGMYRIFNKFMRSFFFVFREPNELFKNMYRFLMIMYYIYIIEFILRLKSSPCIDQSMK